jgi:hypothetical protein
MEPGLLLQIGGMLVGAAAVYGGIRSDLKGMAERLARAESAIEAAGKRFDGHIELHLKEHRA